MWKSLTKTCIVPLPDLEVIKAHIPKEGIQVGDFARKPEITRFAKHPQFISMLRANADFDTQTRHIWPKGARPKPSA